MKTIFVDLGANKGQSIVKAARQFLSNVEHEIHSFETLPYLANALKKHFTNEPHINIYHAAAWIEDCIIDFYVSEKSTESGTLVKYKKTGGIREDVSIKVPAIDFSEWIKKNISDDNFNILKFDIEGAEYKLLRHLIEQNTLHCFDKFYGEFHSDKIENPSKKLIEDMKFVEDYFSKNGITVETWEAPGSIGLVDYKKGTKPSLENSRIADYTPDGDIIYYEV